MENKVDFFGALKWMEQTHTRLLSRVNPPQPVKFGEDVAYRFLEETLQQAILIKLARITSGLRAAYLLLENGLLQEQASLCRMIDEYGEDVLFLSSPLISGERTKYHDQYLEALFKEEISSNSPKEEWHRGRNLVPRKRIRSFNSSNGLSSPNPSDQNATAALLGNVYSGYVHAAAVQVLEMYDPFHGKFSLSGLQNSEFFEDHSADILNYFARGFFAYGYAAAAIGETRLAKEAAGIGDEFAGIQ